MNLLDTGPHGLRMAPMKNDNLMTVSGKLTNDMRSDEPTSTDQKNFHLPPSVV
jgi:hypothetical protein